ncbi:MAG: hypothetical protein KKE20_05095 [Nanoarchaeota archaeon]|nr:hypothetical protein [Nanoarchaeota archaeon]
MTTKRGQVTVFIIIGIILLAIISAVYYSVSRGSQVDVSDEVTIDTSSLSSFVTTCAKQTAQDAVIYTGQRGGLFTGISDIMPLSGDYYIYNGIAIPYYFYEGEDKSLTEDDIKATLQQYMNTYLPRCTSGFQVFKQQGYIVEEGEISSTATLAEEQVIFDIQYPITLIKGDSRDSESAFNAKVNVMLPNIISAVNQYINDQNGKPNAFRLQHLIDNVWEKNLKFDAVDRGNGNVVISLIDENNPVKGNPYIFNFAVKYNWE